LRGSRTSTQPGLNQRFTALEASLDLAEGRLAAGVVAAGRQLQTKAAERLRHGTDYTLVAMLGATGSGKSSLSNALVGSDVATTGVRRPTTSSTLACVFGEHDAADLLTWLEVKNRHLVGSHTSELAGLVLLDVPDHDSVAVDHRLEMERIAEHVDLLVWVTDTEKYADQAMHTYLRQLSAHGAVVVTVLNKIDQLSPNDLDTVDQDLHRLLISNGLAEPVTLRVSATTGDGVRGLREVLANAVRQREAMTERLGADINVVAAGLAATVGIGNTTLGRGAASSFVDELVSAAGIEAVTDAVSRGHRRDAAAATGWPFTRWAHRLRPHPLRKLHLGSGSQGRTSLPEPTGAQQARVQSAIRSVADTVSHDLSEPWPTLLRDAAQPDSRVLHDQLDEAVGLAVRDHRQSTPRWWSVVGTVQFALAVAVVTGALWLLALGLVGYLQLPEVPTPTYRRVPVPTGLLVGGALAGWILAVMSRQLAKIGGQRRGSSTRRAASAEVKLVADQLVLDPLRNELEVRSTLIHQLAIARSGSAPTS
jgi:GTP-binding protein EngB required for normal cell division